MDDRLILGLPPGPEADAPKKRFDYVERESRLNAFITPLFIAAAAFVMRQWFGSKEESHPLPKGPSAPNHLKLAPDTDDDTHAGPGQQGADPVAPMRAAGGSSSLVSEPAVPQPEPSSFTLIRQATPPLRSHPFEAAHDWRLAGGNDNVPLPSRQPAGDDVPQPAAGGAAEAGGAGTASGSNPSDPAPPNPPAEPTDTSPPSSDDDGPTRPANRRPVVIGPVYLAGGLVNESFIISLSDLLTGASDADADVLAVQSLQVSGGDLAALGPGVWRYTPAHDDPTTVVFHYAISDGTEAVPQTAYARLLPATAAEIVGTEDDDVIVGTPQPDVIVALGGDDIVYGRESADIVFGGDGMDRLIGGDGDDVLWGGPGNDVLFGGPGDDTLFGGDGDDVLYGEAGDDVLHGGAGRDRLVGGEGDDRLDGGDGDDVLCGDAGADVLDGGDGNDCLDGGDGKDLLIGGAGDDVVVGGADDDEIDAGAGCNTVNGGTGADTVHISTVAGFDIIDGGDDSDTIAISEIDEDATVDLPFGLVWFDGFLRARVFEIENVRGGHGRDQIVADEHVNVMVGGSGDDTFVWTSLRALTNEGAPADRIADFAVGDRIDLSRLECELDDFAGKKLFFAEAGSAEFGEVGAVTYHHALQGTEDVTVIDGNLDDDPDAEFQIVLDGVHDLTADDFVLAAQQHDSGTQAHA